tara:strand:- start:448 stop:1809 length:1362 start_codon:yes stop_codon:yes gene_type:complete
MQNKKNIIIVGTGEIGMSIASKLLKQGHNVSVIEKDRQHLENLSNNFDIQAVHGNGCLPKNLKAAGAEKADALIALSSVDEVNMVACQVAYSIFDIDLRMARIYNNDYLEHDYKNLFNDEDLPVDYIISPEQQVADRLLQTLNIPRALDVTYFSNDKEVVFAIKLDKEFKHFKRNVEELKAKVPHKFEPMLAVRKDTAFIPVAETSFVEDDIVYFLLETKEVEDFLGAIGYMHHQEKNIMLIGGGNTGFAVAKELEKHNYNIKIVEKDMHRANYLAEVLVNSTVINIDAMEFKLLEETNIKNMDIVLNLTDSDEVNSLCSMYQHQAGCKNIYTLIKNSLLGDLTDKMHYAKVITPRNITASKIIRFLRDAKIYNLYNIQNDGAEIMEVKLNKTSPLNGMTIEQFNKHKKIKIGAVINQKGTSYAPDTMMHAGDRIILLGIKEALPELYDLIEK